jgi:hypothetical protein
MIDNGIMEAVDLAPSIKPETLSLGCEPTHPPVLSKASAGTTEFLSRVLPWPESEDAPGYGNIHWTFAPDDGGDPRWAGKPFRTAADAAGFVDWLLTKPSTRDIYFCLSRQGERKPGKKPGSFNAVRNQRNAILLKSLWIDIDVKAGPTGYSNLSEAWAAFTKFYHGIGLPQPSAVVRSGGGLHVYFISKTALAPDQWRPLATALKSAAVQHGLRCDAGCTIDAARILRVPGTWNCKSEPWRPVQLLMLGGDRDF